MTVGSRARSTARSVEKTRPFFLVLYILIKLSQDPTVRVFPTNAATGSAVAAALFFTLALAACSEGPAPQRVAGGDAKLGKRLIDQYQCGSCHTIPGVPAARGTAGPPLDRFGRRSYIAGAIPNLPDSLGAWLVHPAAVKPGTSMPDLGVSPGEARHMAAYLYTLQ
jgi:cytochrome c